MRQYNSKRNSFAMKYVFGLGRIDILISVSRD